MEFENTFQVTGYNHTPHAERSIQFTPGGTAIAFDPEETSESANVHYEDDSAEEELEIFDRDYHGAREEDNEDEGEEGMCLSETGNERSEYDDSNEEEDVIEENNQGLQSSRSQGRTVNIDASVLPEPPEYEPFHHAFQPHQRVLHLPETFQISGSGSRVLDFFGLLFDKEDLEILAENTNLYAQSKGALSVHKRRWYSTSAGELQVFLALIFYMGVWQSPQYTDYWAKTYKWPQHSIGKYMSQFRFEQIKRYIHISPPYESLSRAEWYRKIQPLSTNLSSKFRKFLIPASDVAVDEMMVRFTGRSAHTQRISSKPIPHGFKILALCEHGYTWDYILTSRLDSFAELNQALYTGDLTLSQTSKAVYQLAHTLPYCSHSFTLYMDNYFTNIYLLSALRTLGIGGCGTARTNSKEYPAVFKFGQRKPCFPHNTISGVICRDVLAVLWQDNNLVRFLTTVHSITGYPNPATSTANWPLKERRRPRCTPYNRRNIKFAWGHEARKTLPTPQIAIDYNLRMNGVDLSDQFRCYYATQLRVSRN